MHGLGNDFVFVSKSDLGPELNLHNFILEISQRNIGIGCDQFIVINEKDDFIEMEVYNPDGSSAEACGNATRCITKLMCEKRNISNLNVFVKGRKLECNYINKIASVNMGAPKYNEAWMPDDFTLNSELSKFLSPEASVIAVDMGNPHLVIIDNSISENDMKILGPKFEKLNIFKNGVNVNFASVNDEIINLKVWERGTGFTYACGSGACASFAACNKLGFTPDNAIVRFELGDLKMSFKNSEVIMSGAAELVAEGVYYYGA